MTKLIALVPMRHHSQRIPGKNYRLLAGKPLFHHIIETLLAVPEIDQVAVDTDSEPVMEGLQKHFPSVTIIKRPDHLRADDVPMNDILLHDTELMPADYYLQTHSTNPLLRPETVARAVQSFFGSYPDHDSLFSVTRLQTRLYDQYGEALNHNPGELIQTQDLPPVYEENSCLYIFTRENLAARRHRIGGRPFLFEIDADEAWDIDEELDFEICDYLFRDKAGVNRADQVKAVVARWSSIPWYPIVFGAYPVLYLLSFNVGQVHPVAGLRSLLLSMNLGGILFLLLYLLLRNRYRAAFLAALWLELFFSYGHIYNLVAAKYQELNITPWMLSAWAILAVLAALWATRPAIPFVASVLPLNVIALGLVVMTAGQLALSSRPPSVRALGADNAPVQDDLSLPESPPDVYFFVLDSYTRQDLLMSAYDYDNSEFISALEQRGFYVAGCSQSNYTRTELSLTSTLNMAHLEGLDDEFEPDNISRLTLWDSLQHGAVRYNFESLGYQTVSFASGFAFVELKDADVFLSPPPLSSSLTEFEALFLRTTMARHLEDLGWVDANAIIAQNFRDRFTFVFDSMEDLAHMPGQKFAYIHIISPHPPFVFGPDGEHTYPADFWNEKQLYPSDLYAQGYTNQVTYLNKKLLAAIDILQGESEVPPVIIIQGDHGPWLQPRGKHFWILNAMYLPGHEDVLYPSISPVNTFRVVFNAYFKGKYDMLPDVSYFSPVPHLYEFSEVPNTCQ